ncbi:hypothetical protein OROHE_013322 [Orobanche hederae]
MFEIISMGAEESSSNNESNGIVQLSTEERFNLIRSIGEECIHENELERLLANKREIICYDGFEPSGRMHIAQGVMKAINVNKLTTAGCKVKILIADEFALMNNKMGGDMKKIQTLGQYLIEIWKAVGMNLGGGQVEFVWSSEEIKSGTNEYWPLVLDIAKRNTLSRILRCCQIMGRSEKDELSAAQIFYPCMQCADIFFLKADICQLGMDQRKVNMLAREYCDDIKRKNKPVILSHHMLPGFLEGQGKMSKSDPSSAIFMEDDEADVNFKIQKAFCPPKVVENNPCLEYIKYIIFPWLNEFTVERDPENGGSKTFMCFEDLVAHYESGELHPGDIKPALVKALNLMLQPVRDHFINNPTAKELLKRVKLNAKAFSKETEEISNCSETLPSQLLQSLSISPQLQLRLNKRFELIRSIGEECTQEDELEKLLANKPHIICYDGFEPSGRMHIAQGIMKIINVKKLISAGCKVKILIADLFAWLNSKMGSDEKKIQVIGQYMIEIFKAFGLSVDGGQVEFIWSSEEINSRAHEYWPLVEDIAIRTTLSRIQRCHKIMGLSETDELSAAHIFYTCMQCADIFFHKADICQMGMDQYEVNMLAREYCDDIKRKNKPIILSHHMLPGFQEGHEKMSKSDSSPIFMEDVEVDVSLKIKKAFCPPKVVEKNPCIEYIKHIVFPWFNEFTVVRKPENGVTFKSFEDLIVHYESGELHPGDLKPSLAKALNLILQPVRDHFNNDAKAKELLKRVKLQGTDIIALPTEKVNEMSSNVTPAL